MAKLPTTVQVGAYCYDIICDDDTHARYVRSNGGDVYGATNHREQAIVLAASNGKDVQAVTLAHELLHVACFATGTDHLLEGYGDGLEEQLIQQLSPMLVETLRANPTLVKFLVAKG